MVSHFASPPPKNILERYASPPSNSKSFSRSAKKARTPDSILKRGQNATYDARVSAKKQRPATDSFNRYGGSRSHKLFTRYRNDENSPLKENTSSNRRGAQTQIVKRCSGNRLQWTKDTPTKNRRDERTIRRLTGREKDNLYDNRPDLDPANGYFDMGAWMNGGGAQEEEDDDYLSDDSEEEEEELLVSSDEEDDDMVEVDMENSDSFHDAMESENPNNLSGSGSFLERLIACGGGDGS
mmetsp:Transcript_18022/g.33500  ORF Transcript_18022/g.33500 Transcript_18022/m.33500 type:complete len:239 (-) Transcript_18022:105-821(-)|eukprot:CAMPEP_0182503992 /NCGR_PEP_ID=MMETSP1321-20130603/16375_1 /TAXON_ID=91990 /ORGANISM="Bolidomonas sp., Strain RCC1657" /LENGTH=238 /DNA_ID=CAMNT_0024709253 /DNA_START=153 /DNA_END=869 /DNA_ORIENTATION=+